MVLYKSSEVEVPRPPVLCNKCGKQPSALNGIVVKTTFSQELKGAFSEYGRYDRSRRKVRLFLKPGYQFVRWESRCETCHPSA